MIVQVFHTVKNLISQNFKLGSYGVFKHLYWKSMSTCWKFLTIPSLLASKSIWSFGTTPITVSLGRSSTSSLLESLTYKSFFLEVRMNLLSLSKRTASPTILVIPPSSPFVRTHMLVEFIACKKNAFHRSDIVLGIYFTNIIELL